MARESENDQRRPEGSKWKKETEKIGLEKEDILNGASGETECELLQKEWGEFGHLC